MPYSNLRKGRASIIGQAYLVTAVTADRTRFFDDLRLARIVISALGAHDRQRHTRTLAFVVMPDHLHWLLELTSRVPLERVIKHVKGTTARQINNTLSRTGSVWQPSFYDHALRREESLESAARFVRA